MKKGIMLTLCLLFAAIAIGTAQECKEKKCPERQANRTEMTKRATERMKNELSLTDDQTAKVEALNNEYLPKMRMAHPKKRPAKGNLTNTACPKKQAKPECNKKELNYCNCCDCKNGCNKQTESNKPENAEGKKRKEEMKAMRKEYNAKLNEILTPEQQEKYKAMRKGKREYGKKKK